MDRFATLADVVVLAHQGGWDEILMVAAPVAIFAILLRMANRRAQRLAEDQEAGGSASPLAQRDVPNERAGPS